MHGTQCGKLGSMSTAVSVFRCSNLTWVGGATKACWAARHVLVFTPDQATGHSIAQQ
jgi:hypothetical protein